VVSSAIGGMNVTQTIEGQERYPVNVRYPQEDRNSPEKIAMLPIVTPSKQIIALGDVAEVFIEDGPPGIKSENARLTGWSLIDIKGTDIGTYVENAQKTVNEQLILPAGYSIAWAGQYEYMQRAKDKLTYVVPLTLLIIMLLLFMNFRNITEVAIIMGTLPFALVGSIWLMYLEGFNFSIAVGVGFIALAGVAVEIGVIMLVYLNQSYQQLVTSHQKSNTHVNQQSLLEAVTQGAGLRVRPVMMTSLSIIIGLLPILYGTGTGSEVMSRIAAPMVGGMVSALILTLIVLPVIYYLWRSKTLKQTTQEQLP
jgi:Cu(I)/Ag(I) efflux system membrane protein CusA/SilA